MDKKLVAYITSSFPDNEFTKDLVFSMASHGVDILELGVPFSDPVADGPVIEKANHQALANGFKLDDLFDVSQAVAKEIDTLWMGYFNPFYHYGFKNFMQKANQYGVEGFIIPDLPFEENQLYNKELEKLSLSTTAFVAPTDSLKRIQTITNVKSKFIYLVAYAGITGNGTQEDLSKVIENIRTSTKTPIYIGFGVDENSAKEKVKDVDGVIVGSAFVKHLLDDSLSYSEKITKISSLSKLIKNRINE